MASPLPPKWSSTGSLDCLPRRRKGSKPSDLASVLTKAEPTTEPMLESTTEASRGKPLPPVRTISSSCSASPRRTRQLEPSATIVRSRDTIRKIVPSPRKSRLTDKKLPYRYIMTSINFHTVSFNVFSINFFCCYLLLSDCNKSL